MGVCFKADGRKFIVLGYYENKNFIIPYLINLYSQKQFVFIMDPGMCTSNIFMFL